MIKLFKDSNFGYFYALTSALLFGASTPVAKYLVGGVNPWLLAGMLYLGSGLGLIITLFIRYLFFKQNHQEANLTGYDYRWLAGSTLFGGILGPLLLMIGLTQTAATTASLLLNLETVLTAIIAWIIFKEHTDKRLVLGMILIVMGGVVLVMGNHAAVNQIMGPLFIAAACLAWAFDNNMTRKISAADPLKIVMIKSLVAGTVNVLLATLFGFGLWNKWPMITLSAIIGFLGYGLSIIFFILGLRHIGTARTSACFSLAPFVGACLALIFLNEPLSIHLILAGILMAIGIGLHLSEHHEHEHTHELLTHAHKHYHDDHHQHEHHPDDPIGEPHTHLHTHQPLRHSHPHYPDIHHRHKH